MLTVMACAQPETNGECPPVPSKLRASEVKTEPEYRQSRKSQRRSIGHNIAQEVAGPTTSSSQVAYNTLACLKVCCPQRYAAPRKE